MNLAPSSFAGLIIGGRPSKPISFHGSLMVSTLAPAFSKLVRVPALPRISCELGSIVFPA
jgi:hypothetical protein